MRIEGKCQKCGLYRWSLDKDHIIPVSKGGTDDPSNIQYLCQNCHYDKTLEDRKGVKHSEQTNAQKSARMREFYAKHPEMKEITRRTHLGRKRSDETRQNISRGLMGNKNCLGSTRVMTPEHRAKLSAAKKGKSLSAEHRRAISLGHARGKMLQ